MSFISASKYERASQRSTLCCREWLIASSICESHCEATLREPDPSTAGSTSLTRLDLKFQQVIFLFWSIHCESSCMFFLRASSSLPTKCLQYSLVVPLVKSVLLVQVTVFVQLSRIPAFSFHERGMKLGGSPDVAIVHPSLLNGL